MKHIPSELNSFAQFWDSATAYLPLPALLLLVAAVVVHFLIRDSKRSYRGARQRSRPNVIRPKDRNRSDHASGGRTNMADPKAQMEAISKVRFEKTRLLNKEEAKLLPLLEDIVKNIGKGHRVMAQTSLGELIRPISDDKKKWAQANASINSKRLDFAVVNRWGILAAALEYQGSGHYHHDSFMRDAVKREALRKAGVPLIEVEKAFEPDDLRRDLIRHLTEKPPLTAS